jgi:hypothetical protein
MAKEKEDFMTSKWRPMMAVTYMVTIIFDFVLGPILFNLLQYWNPGQAIGMWVPLTLQGGGMYHIAMGAVLGISAWTRGQEKVALVNSPDPAPVPPVMMSQPVPQAAPATFGAPQSGFATAQPASFAAPTPAANSGFGSNFNTGARPATTTGFGGKPAPAPHIDPEI